MDRLVIGQECQGFAGPVYPQHYIRQPLYFYLPDLTSGGTKIVTITSASIKLYAEEHNVGTYWAGNSTLIYEPLYDFNITIQKGLPGFPHIPGDYSIDYDYSKYYGSGGTFPSNHLTGSGYDNITLNSTGLGWITSGWTTFMLRSDRDINHQSLTSAINAYRLSNAQFYMSTPGKQPLLYIEYTLDNTPTAIHTFSMVLLWVFVAIAVAMVTGLIYSGLPLIPMLVLGAILIALASAGAQAIAASLLTFF
jgi:uncharacterized protein YaaQ